MLSVRKSRSYHKYKSIKISILILNLQVFRRRRKLYLVFEYVDHTILGETEIIWEVDNIFAQSENNFSIQRN